MGFRDNVNVNVRGAAHIAPCTYKTVVLKQNITKQNLNVLTQAMLDEYGKNTKFVIKWDYVLNSGAITIPEGCLLEFDGGSISNGTLTGQNTGIQAELVKIFGIDVTLDGTWSFTNIYPEWFGALGDGEHDDTVAIQKAVYTGALDGIRLKDVVFSRMYYLISNTIIVPRFSHIVGANHAKRFNFDVNNPYIYINQNKPIIKIKNESGDSYVSRVCIENLSFGRTSYYTDIAIDLSDSDITGLVIKNVLVNNVKFGLYSQTNKVISKLFIDNFMVNPDHSVGFAVYLDTSIWASQIVFRDCFFTNTYIGGVHIRCSTINTPIIFESCAFDKCGTQYNLNDYLEYGTSAIYIECGIRGNVLISGCYFETSFPYRDYGDGTYDSEYEERDEDLQQIYIKESKINKRNTAEVVINGNQNTTTFEETVIVDIKDSEFQVNYQSIQIVRSCRLDVRNTLFLRPGISEGVPVYGFYDFQQPAIARIVEAVGGNTHVSIKDIAIRKDAGISQGFQILSDTQDSDITNIELDVDIDTPEIKESYKHSKANDETIVYLDINGSQYFNLGTPDNPFNTIEKVFSYASSLYSRYGRRVLTIICQNGLSYNNAVTFPEGMDYNIIINSGKKWNLSKQTDFKNSNVVIVGDIEKTANVGYLNFVNCNIAFKASKITFNYAGSIPFITASDSYLLMLDVTVPQSSPQTGSMSDQKLVWNGSAGELITQYVNFVNTAHSLYCYDSSISKMGTAEQRPLTTNTSLTPASAHGGLMFYNTTLGKPIFFDGTTWRFADGNRSDAIYSGTFANKPAAARINVGFAYFCTDKQTTEGATDGIMIYHKGSDVWVDALGRVVS